MRPFGYAYGVWPTGEHGCGGPTRTGDTRVMSPLIYLLIYTAEMVRLLAPLVRSPEKPSEASICFGRGNG